MPRYFYHIHGGRPYHDDGGVDLPDDAAAWREAKRFARDIEANLEPGGSWHLEVHREDRPIYALTIGSHLLDFMEVSMGLKEACAAIASICREQSSSDHAHREFWLRHEAEWDERARADRNELAVTHEVHQGRMVPKPAED
jgi:hypothetical protein